MIVIIGLMRHHPLREQAGERFGKIDQADVLERAGPEPRVEQVQNRVFDPADILLDRQPLLEHFRIERPVPRLAGKTQEIPRGIDESIERIGLAGRGVAALRAGHMLPRRMAQQRIARGLEIDILGQNNRQVLLRHRHHTADLAVDERDRRAPIALARNAPVAQAALRLGFAPAVLGGHRDHCCLGLIHGHAGHPA